MKSKLAIFDFDHTIKHPRKGWQMGVSHFFPDGEIPEDIHQIRKEQGWDSFCIALYTKVIFQRVLTTIGQQIFLYFNLKRKSTFTKKMPLIQRVQPSKSLSINGFVVNRFCCQYLLMNYLGLYSLAFLNTLM